MTRLDVVQATVENRVWLLIGHLLGDLLVAFPLMLSMGVLHSLVVQAPPVGYWETFLLLFLLRVVINFINMILGKDT